MKKAMTITYEVGGNLYLNITNRCPCACTFCIRTLCDGAYGSDPLWLEHEPSQRRSSPHWSSVISPSIGKWFSAALASRPSVWMCCWKRHAISNSTACRASV